MATIETTAKERPVFRDPKASVEDRLKDLLSRMTLPEKLAQLGGQFPSALLGPSGFDAEKAASLIGNGVGHLSLVTSVAPEDPEPMVRLLNSAQRYLVEKTRLGIPAICHNEALSGLLVEPGPVEVVVGSSSADIRARGRFEIGGEPRVLTHRRAFRSTVTDQPTSSVRG